MQLCRSELLRSVAERALRLAVALYHQTVQTKVESPLRELEDIAAGAAHVAGIGEERQLGISGTQLDSHLPARVVAVFHLAERRESAVDHAELLDAGHVETLQSAYPQIEVGIDRILDEHRHVGVAQRIGNLLHHERVRRSAGAYPYHVYAVFETFVDMLLVGNLGADLEAGLLTHLLEPFEARSAYAFEASRVGAGFPNTCTKHIDAEGAQSPGCLQHLLFGLSAAGAGDHHRFGEGEEAPFFYGYYVELSCHDFT